MTIQPCQDDDLPAFLEIGNAVMPLFAETIEEVRFRDRSRDPRCQLARWVAWDEGRPVGAAEYSQNVWTYHPRRFELFVGVLEGSRRQGIGGALYETMLAALAPFDPIKLTAWTCEAFDEALRFLQARGFSEQLREQQSRLDLATFDPPPFAAARQRMGAEGIRITHLAALRQKDPDTLVKIHALGQTITGDIPSADPPQPVPFEQWVKRLESPNFFPEGITVAIDEASGAYVGLSALWRRQVDRELDQAITGVRREWRRKGIALAMKLAGIEAAQRMGATGIRTDNEVNNLGMLAINQRLGFVPLPAWIEMSKELSP